MPTLLLPSAQRFTCAQCGRCCRRGLVELTPGEVELYRKADVRRLFRESADHPEGTDRDPLEPIPGFPGRFAIRQRADRTCGFLGPDNRCRIHEDLGEAAKPLTCRVFPLRFQTADDRTLVGVSFTCPSVVANQGRPLSEQLSAIRGLHAAWTREHAPPMAGPAEVVRGHRLERRSLDLLRSALLRVLERPGGDATPDLRLNLRRAAAMLEDLTRYRVLRLAPQRFAEYLELVTTHAASAAAAPLPPREASWLGRLAFRGLLFSALATQARHQATRRLWLRTARLLAHAHGLPGAVGEVDLRAARRLPIALADPAVHAIALNYLRAAIESLGSGRRPVVDELALSVSIFNAGAVLGAIEARRRGRGEVDAACLSEGLMWSAELEHADSGRFATRLTALSGGLEALRLLPALPVC